MKPDISFQELAELTKKSLLKQRPLSLEEMRAQTQRLKSKIAGSPKKRNNKEK